VWSDQGYLGKCQALSRLGYRPRLEGGMLIGRGFADLGFEVFVLQPADKLLSLFTSTVSSLPPADSLDRANFFHVILVDEAVNVLLELGSEISSLEFRDKREWFLSLDNGDSPTETYHARDLEQVFIDALLDLYQQKKQNSDV